MVLGGVLLLVVPEGQQSLITRVVIQQGATICINI